MHEKPNINFDKAQEDQTLASRKLTHCLSISDGFELEFSGSSEPELWKFRADPSQAGAL